MRFVPRFSLRFLLFAVTIFVIVFGVGVKYWRAYQEHKRLVTQFREYGCDVIEEPRTLFGVEVGQRLAGIDATWPIFSFDYVELLENLTRPEDFRYLRAGNSERIEDSIIDRTLRAMARCPALTELQLCERLLTRPQLQALGRLRSLRHLDLTKCRFPDDSLAFLEELVNLEVLILDETDVNVSDLLQLQLPRLRVLKMNESKFAQDPPDIKLALTKQGWGRFPCLETLILRENDMTGIVIEPGALPRLKHLDLGYTGMTFEKPTDFRGLAEALPRLELFALPTVWLEPELTPELAKLQQLKFLYIQADAPRYEYSSSADDRLFWNAENQIIDFAPLSEAQIQKNVPPRLIPAINALLKLRPELYFSANNNAVRLQGEREAKSTTPWREWSDLQTPGGTSAGFN